MDQVCLIAAIAATVTPKTVVGKAPFSDSEAQTGSNARDYHALKCLLWGDSTPNAT